MNELHDVVDSSSAYILLDKESGKLRSTTKGFADFLAASTFSPQVKSGLEKALLQINTCKIDEMDEAMNHLRSSLVIASGEMEKNPQKQVKENEVESYFKFSNDLTTEIKNFVEKAYEISSKMQVKD